jgi:ribosomal protein L16 Arg81 hydroxylase
MTSETFVQTMESRENISEEDFLENFAIPNKPVLLKGYMRDWKAFGKWNESFFTKNYGDRMVNVSASRDRNDKRQTKLGDFLSCLESPDKKAYYLRDWTIEDEAPELFNDYAVPSFFKSWLDFLPGEMKPRLKWLYIGPKGSGSPLHTDIWDTSAWNGVFTGKKLWHFYPLDQLEFLYDLRPDTFNPDYEKYPLLKKVKPLSCIQSPGDIVFTPSGWIHQVYNAEPGISLTENFINKTNAEVVRNIFERSNQSELLQYLKTLMVFVKNNGIDY